MNRGTFFILDVFTDRKYAGNQLAVFTDAGSIPDAEMQQIAREMHFSETTFILSDKPHQGGYDVRIFTPAAEIPFAGHPTLGSAFVIQRELIGKPVEKVVLNLKVGRIPVTFCNDGSRVTELWMKQISPAFGQTLQPEQLAPVLNLAGEDVDSRFPIQEVSTGTFTLILPLKTLDAVKRARVNLDQYYRLIEGIQAKTVLIFCPQTHHADNHLHVRFFADYYGVPEDPATGSANGCLAGWLVKHRYFGESKIDVRVEQGYEIGRPSQLLLRAEANGDQIDVFVGGKVVMVAKGELV